MHDRFRGTVKSHYTPLWFPRLVTPALEWAVFLAHRVVGLGWSGVFGSFLFGCLEFVGYVVVSLGDWREAEGHIAAPRDLVLGHR